MSLTKICTVCKIAYPLTSFHKLAKSKDGHGYRCRTCDYAARKAYRERKKSEVREKKRIINWQTRFNLTPEQYYTMLENQGGGCAICGTKNPCGENSTSTHLKVMAVDHCHTTGKVRGLLCNPCNRGLGFFKDSIELLNKAKNYLSECH